MKHEIKIALDEGVIMPKFETGLASGFDVRAYSIKALYRGKKEVDPKTIEELNQKFKDNGFFQLREHERAIFGTGTYYSIPDTIELQLRPKSGISIKTGIQVILGTIDSDFKGKEVGIIVVNSSQFLTTVKYGQRLAQIVPVEKPKVVLVQVDKIDEGNRGGFGHTGIN